MSEKPLTFLASIAPLQSAITIASDGGARVKIDVPDSEMAAIVRLVLYRGMTLKVTIEPESLQNKQKQSGTTKRNNQQSQWAPRQKPSDDGDS